jgi:hypothetical protein
MNTFVIFGTLLIVENVKTYRRMVLVIMDCHGFNLLEYFTDDEHIKWVAFTKKKVVPLLEVLMLV